MQKISHLKIIVADDEEMIRELLYRQLSKEGYDVTVASNGKEAWELFQKQGADVAVVDLDMPKMRGEKLVEKIKGISPSTVIIVLTGHGTLESAMKVMELGGDEYLLKPIMDINRVSFSIRHAVERQRLQFTFNATILALASVIERRDPYTAGHQRRVSQLADSIGMEMGFSESRMKGLHIAGILHDIGKINIPAEILNRPGKLSRLEFELIQTHSSVGYEILNPIGFPWPVARIVYQHHERMNGSGYPQGLSGDTILLEAKILAVSDVVEAMASHRPYRPQLGIEKALEEIKKNKGTLYDSDVTDACIHLFSENGFTFK